MRRRRKKRKGTLDIRSENDKMVEVERQKRRK